MKNLPAKGSNKLTVVCADRFFMVDEALKMLESAGRVVWADAKNETELVVRVRDSNAKVIISEYLPITDLVLEASPDLKGIVVWGVGYNHVDVDAASERGIYVANTSGSNAESVSEHVFALILGLSRKLLPTDSFVRQGNWTSSEETALPKELISEDLYGKKIGIVGLGAIGARIARIAHGFNMQVLAFDPYVSFELAKDRGAEPVNLERLLKESDFITLHVVLTKETRGMISIKQFDMMKPTAFLINASRGPVVDEKALVKALNDRKIAGAGLDVFDKEPVDRASSLLRMKNVILTPHCAGGSREALIATSLTVAEETTRILNDQIPRNLVNRSALVKKGFVT